MADFGAGAGDGGGTRGVYWKRNDSMRLVHLLIDRDLKSAFIAAESKRSPPGDTSVSNKQFWQMAATKFNDQNWQPAHLFPSDPHLMKQRAFTPTKKSKEVESQYLREKFKALKRQFNTSVKRWEEGGQSRVENFWKCSGTAPGTSDEGCWYMFLVLWVNKNEEVLNVVLDKGGHSAQTSATGAGGGSRKRPRDAGAYQSFDDYDGTSELQSELKVESLFKQQAEVLKYVSLCFESINTIRHQPEEQREFWRSQLATAQAQLQHIQSKLPSQPPPPPNPPP